MGSSPLEGTGSKVALAIGLIFALFMVIVILVTILVLFAARKELLLRKFRIPICRNPALQSPDSLPGPSITATSEDVELAGLQCQKSLNKSPDKIRR